VLGVALIVASACCFGSLAIFGRFGYRLGLTLPQLVSIGMIAAGTAWLAVRRRELKPA